MADTEKNEDQKISRCLQEAFGYTDEQLLKQLDQANETLKDVTFDGAEDRIMKKIMARKAELEKQTSAPEPETERNITLVTAALVAVIAGMLGGTAVGKKNYFFRWGNDDRTITILDTDRNKRELSEIESVYEKIEKELKIPVLKLGYYPNGMSLYQCTISEDEAELQFSYQNNYIDLIQAKREKSYSINIESDRVIEKTVFNEWIQQDIKYKVKEISDEEAEYELLITYQNKFYYFTGVMDQKTFLKIVKNLNFY